MDPSAHHSSSGDLFLHSSKFFGFLTGHRRNLSDFPSDHPPFLALLTLSTEPQNDFLGMPNSFMQDVFLVFEIDVQATLLAWWLPISVHLSPESRLNPCTFAGTRYPDLISVADI